MAIDSAAKRASALTLNRRYLPKTIIPVGSADVFERRWTVYNYVGSEIRVTLRPFRNRRLIPNWSILSSAAPGEALPLYSIVIRGDQILDQTVVKIGSVAITRQIRGPGQCTFTLINQRPGQTDQVKIWNNRTEALIFAGWVTRTTDTPIGMSGEFECQVACNDNASIVDKRTMRRYWQTDTAQVVVWNIVFEALDGTWPQTPGVGIQFAYWTILGGIILDYTASRQYVRELLDYVARFVGQDWMIDVRDTLRFLGGADDPTRGFIAAPFSISSALANWYNARVTRTLTRFYNEVFTESNIRLVNVETETFTATGVVDMFVLKMPINVKPAVFVDDVEAVVVAFDQAGAGVFAEFYYSDVAIWRNRNISPLTPGAIVTVKYPSKFNYEGHAKDQASIDEIGLFQGIIQMGDVYDQATLDQGAEKELDRGLGEQVIVEVQTREDGLEPGMLLPIDLSPQLDGINDTFAIESVSSKEVGQEFFEHSVKATSTQYKRVGSSRHYVGDIVTRLRPPLDRLTNRLTWTIAGTIRGQENPGLEIGPFDNARRWEKSPLGILAAAIVSFKEAPDISEPIVFDVLRNGVSIFDPDAEKIVLRPGQSQVVQWRFIADTILTREGYVWLPTSESENPLVIDGTLDLVFYG